VRQVKQETLELLK